MNDKTEDFQKRRMRRLAEWKGVLTDGFPPDERPINGSSPEDNLSALEDLRKMVYPEMATLRMNREIERISGR